MLYKLDDLNTPKCSSAGQARAIAQARAIVEAHEQFCEVPVSGCRTETMPGRHVYMMRASAISDSRSSIHEDIFIGTCPLTNNNNSESKLNRGKSYANSVLERSKAVLLLKKKNKVAPVLVAESTDNLSQYGSNRRPSVGSSNSKASSSRHEGKG